MQISVAGRKKSKTIDALKVIERLNDFSPPSVLASLRCTIGDRETYEPLGRAVLLRMEGRFFTDCAAAVEEFRRIMRDRPAGERQVNLAKVVKSQQMGSGRHSPRRATCWDK